MDIHIDGFNVIIDLYTLYYQYIHLAIFYILFNMCKQIPEAILGVFINYRLGGGGLITPKIFLF